MFDNRNFNDLYFFVLVVRWGNFTKAAAALNLLPSALSHRMSELEKRLNIKLLNRTTRSMSPTEAGRQLFDRIAPMFSNIQQELVALGDFNQKIVGKLRINAPENPAHYLIYSKMKAFLQENPEVKVEILINNCNVDIVAECFDFGVRLLPDVPGDMVAVKISDERPMVVVASPAYLAAHGTPKTLQELSRHRCLVTSLDSYSRLSDWEFMQKGQVIRLSVPPDITFNSTMLIKRAALDSLGITWLPLYAVEQELSSGELVEIFAKQRIIYPPMCLYYPVNRYKTQAAQALIDYLKA